MIAYRNNFRFLLGIHVCTLQRRFRAAPRSEWAPAARRHIQEKEDSVRDGLDFGVEEVVDGDVTCAPK